MSTKSRRTTVYFRPAVHRAFRLKAAQTEQGVSDLVNEAVLRILAEESEDPKAFRGTRH